MYSNHFVEWIEWIGESDRLRQWPLVVERELPVLFLGESSVIKTNDVVQVK